MKDISEYKDANAKVYKLGDIVYNPFFGDYWLVEQYTEQEMKDYDTECPYCLSLYGSKDIYSIDIDEPVGFVIVCHKRDPKYEEYIQAFKKVQKEENVNE